MGRSRAREGALITSLASARARKTRQKGHLFFRLPVGYRLRLKEKDLLEPL